MSNVQETELQALGKLKALLKEELKSENIKLDYPNFSDFCKSQWQKSEKCVLWLIYRWFMALNFSFGVISSVARYCNRGRWFLYLTNWGFLLCGYTSVYAAVIASIYHVNPDKLAECKRLFKIFWASYWTTLVLANMISWVYWLLIYPFESNREVTALYNLWAHAFNSTLFNIDHFLVAFPAHIMHCVYPVGFCLIYTFYNFGFYLTGARDRKGNRYIYDILNWSKPIRPLATILLCIVLLTLISTTQFLIYKLRIHMAEKFGKLMKTETESVPAAVPLHVQL